MRLLLLFVMTLAFSSAQSQDLNPASWSFDINQVGPNDYQLFFQADLEKGWNIYSQSGTGDGPIPTSITYTSNNVSYDGLAQESGDKKEGMDEMFGMEVIKYGSKEAFRMKHKVKVNDISKPVTGYVTYMLCNDSMCLPPRDAEFSFTIKVVNPLGGGN